MYIVQQLIASGGLIVQIACMKKQLFFLALSFSSFISLAQHADKDFHDEVQLGYGFFTAPQIFDRIGNNIIIVPAVILGTNPAPTHVSSNGVITATYLHHTSKRFSFGAEMVYDAYTKTVYDYISESNSDTIKNTFTSILGRYDYNYVQRKNLRAYCGISIGISFIKQVSQAKAYITGNHVKLAGNICPFGIAFGSNKIRYYFETGFGSKPSLATGLCYRF